MNGALAALAILAYAAGWGILYAADHHLEQEHRHLAERATAVVYGGATFAVLLACAGWFAGAWALMSEGFGLLLLILISVALAGFAGFAIVRGRRHQRHATIAAAAALGAAVALWFGAWPEITKNGRAALANAGRGISSAPVTVHGHAAAHGGGGAVLGLLLLAVVLLIALYLIVSKHKSGELKDVPRAITAGGGRAAS